MYFCNKPGCSGHNSFAITCFDLASNRHLGQLTSEEFRQMIMRERRERARWRPAYHRPSKLDQVI